MTTIAYTAGVMAADTRAYAGFNTVLGGKTKIRRCADGTLIGCSTNQVGFAEAVLAWYERGAKPEDIPKATEQKFSFLAVKPNGDAFYAFESFNLSGPIHGEYFSIGSGEGIAQGAMRAGADAKRAVEIASEVDVWTGLPVICLTHDGEPNG